MSATNDLPTPLSARTALKYWLPLEATWLMMAFEGPFLAAIIARLADPKINLAAYGVATSLAWIVESPIVMMLSASNALVRDKIAYRRLRRFSYTLNAAVTVVMAILISPPVFRWVARGIIGLPEDVARLSGQSLAFMIFWPGAIGFRRFYQGILIRQGRPRAVAWGTMVRLSAMAATGSSWPLSSVFREPWSAAAPWGSESSPKRPPAGSWPVIASGPSRPRATMPAISAGL